MQKISNFKKIEQIDASEIHQLYVQKGSIAKVLAHLQVNNTDPRCRKLISTKLSQITGNNNHSTKHREKNHIILPRVLELAPNVKNITQLMQELHIKPIGDNYVRVQRFLQKHNIQLAGKGNPNKWPDNKVYCKNSKLPRSYLSKRVRRDGWLEYKCAICGLLNTWNGKPLSLQLDHENGISNDNRKHNLRWLCGNCHSQTPTFGGKMPKAKRAKKAEYDDILSYVAKTGDLDFTELDEFQKTGRLSFEKLMAPLNKAQQEEFIDYIVFQYGAVKLLE